MVTGTMLTPDNIGSCKDSVSAALVEASPPDFSHFHVPQSCGRGAGLAVIYNQFAVLSFFISGPAQLQCILVYRPSRDNNFIEEFSKLLSMVLQICAYC